MNPSEYQRLAKRTECPQEPIHERIGLRLPRSAPLLHAAIGISGEAGELAGAVEKWLWYNKPLDVQNVKEELGDLLWYIAEACNALDFDMGEIMAANIAKLKARYPEKYDGERAAEENRDRGKEAAAMNRPTPTDWSDLNRAVVEAARVQTADKPKEPPITRTYENVVMNVLMRTPQQIIDARKRPANGCCEEYRDNKPCDCMKNAVATYPHLNPCPQPE